MSQPVENLVAAIVDAGDAQFIVDHPEVAAYIATNQFDLILYDQLNSHLDKYGKVPARDVLEEEWGQPLPKPSEPALFYLDQLRPLHVRKILQAASAEAAIKINSDPEGALDIFDKAIQELRMQRQASAMIDLRYAKDMIEKHLISKWSGTGLLSMGWPTYDKYSGGLMNGDLVSILGSTGIGKTTLLLSRAFHFWEVHKQPVMFVSSEMNLKAILERSVAILSKVPFDYIKHGMFPNIMVDFKAKLFAALNGDMSGMPPFIFIDGDLAITKEDVLRIFNQLKPGLLCADGPYLWGGSSYRDRWQLIAENVTFLKKDIAKRAPVIATWQFDKEAMKLKKGERPTLGNIGGSKEIANLSSVVLGMFQDKTPETINRRTIEVMKGRGGEVGRFDVHWDFLTINFDELAQAENEELEIT